MKGLLGAALATALMVAAPALALPAGAPQAQAESRAIAGTAPAIAGRDTLVTAWLQQTGASRRVIGSVAGTDTALGPSGPGADGAPVAALTADGTVWVLASRDNGDGARLWLQGHRAGTWGAAQPGPRARLYDHHPALVAARQGTGLWAVWIGEDDGSATTALWASRWDGTRWTPAEALPQPLGAPMAPAIALADDGTPVVAWAAGDGNDAEIWISARRGGSWSAPLALTRNLVPDVMPSLAATDTGLLATWISYTDEGYLPVAASATRTDAWQAPVTMSPVPGGRPRAIALDGRPAVAWRRLDEAGGTLVARRHDGDSWRNPVELAAASGSPFALQALGDGRLALAFSRPSGALGIVEGDGDDADRLGSLATAARERYGPASPVRPAAVAVPAPAAVPTVPQSYTAFGDSITNGVVYDPDRRDSGGYRTPLQQMLRSFFRLGTVFNAGVDGEPTSDGVGRIDNAIDAQDPQVILIMEGTNDILAAVDADTIIFNLRRMVERCYEEKPDILPFLAQLPPRLDPGPDGFDGPGNGRIDQVNAALPAVGFEEGATIVDMNTPFDGHRELMSNHVHPSVAGYTVMAEQWFAAIQPLVLDNTNRGDLDGSGRTDGVDLVRLALAFGAIEGEDRYETAADINGDGIVDGFDLDLLIEFFGQDVTGDDDGGGGRP